MKMSDTEEVKRVARLLIGDVVQLNSGGIDMTVTAIHEDPFLKNPSTVDCMWMDWSGRHGTVLNINIACLKTPPQPTNDAQSDPLSSELAIDTARR